MPGLFCLQALPILVFFSCVTSILYYLGVIQWVIFKVTLGTSLWALEEILSSPTEQLRALARRLVKTSLGKGIGVATEPEAG